MIWRIMTVSIGCVFAGVLGVSLADREVPLIIHKAEATRQSFPAGDLARFTYEVYRLRSCESHVDRLIETEDNVRHVLPSIDIPAMALPAGPDKFTTEALIPKTADPGPAVYRVILTFRCNWVHWVWPIYDLPRDIPFEILPPRSTLP